MRAQITLEALMLFAIGVGLLLISTTAISKLMDAQNGMHQAALLKNAVYAIANSADEICALGEGNSRVIPLPKYPFELKSGADNKGLILNSNEIQIAAQTRCEVQIDKKSFGQTAYLWYENSNVIISTAPHP